MAYDYLNVRTESDDFDATCASVKNRLETELLASADNGAGV